MASYKVAAQDLKIARENWLKWTSVFEFEGAPRNNPLLTDGELFRDFLREYSVRRTIRNGLSEELRKKLLEPEFGLQVMLSDTSAQALDARESELRIQFGTIGRLGQVRGIRSAMSKIASFLAPHAFVAYDQFCQKGLNTVLGRSPSYKCGSYREYIGDINRILSGDIGGNVRSACVEKYPSAYAAKRDRFHRRVLDVSLMRLGDEIF